MDSYTLLQVGPQVSADGTNPIARGGRSAEIIVQQLHGRYYEQAFRGSMFAVANQSPVTTSAGLSTTFTGLAVSNPAASGLNLVFNKIFIGQGAAGVAGTVGLMTGAGAAAGSLVPRNRVVGGGTSRATASAGATIATPVLEMAFGSIGSVATTAYGAVPGIVVDLEGSLIVPPGFFVASYTSAATTTALIFGFQWEEVPQ